MYENKITHFTKNTSLEREGEKRLRGSSDQSFIPRKNNLVYRHIYSFLKPFPVNSREETKLHLGPCVNQEKNSEEKYKKIFPRKETFVITNAVLPGRH